MSKRIRVIDTISSAPDHVLFGGAFLIGGFSIIFLRIALNQPALLTLLIPFTILISYFVLIKVTPKYRLREDMAGDNLYYLGFIFTVISLGVALYKFKSNPDEIIGDLGIGLATTVVGLVLKIMLTNLRKDPVETEEIIRIELSDAAEKTSTQLYETTNLMKSVQVQGRQIMEEAQNSIDTANANLLESLQQLDAKLQAVQIPKDMITHKVDPMLDGLGSSIDRLVQKLDAIQMQPDLIDQKVSESFESMNIMVAELRNELDQIDLGSSIEKLDSSVDGLIVKLGSIEIPTDVIANKASSAFDPLEQAAVKLSDKLRSLETSPDSLIDNQERLLNWANSIASNENQLNQLNQTLADVLKALSKTTEQITQSSSDTLEQQKAYRDAFTEIATEINNTKKSISELSGTIQDIGTQFAKVIREITELAEVSTR